MKIEYKIVHHVGVRRGFATRFEEKTFKITTLLKREVEIEDNSTIDHLLTKISTPELLDQLGVEELEAVCFMNGSRLKGDDLIKLEGRVVEIRPLYLDLNRVIYLRSLTGETYPIKLDNSMTFEELRDIALRKTRIEGKFCIIKNGNQMKDGDTLENVANFQLFYVVRKR